MTYHKLLESSLHSLGFEAIMAREEKGMGAYTDEEYHDITDTAVSELLDHLDIDELEEAAAEVVFLTRRPAADAAGDNIRQTLYQTLRVSLREAAREANQSTLEQHFHGEQVVVLRAGRSGVHLHDIVSPKTHARRVAATPSRS